MSLQLDQISAGYGKAHVLSDISLTVTPGRICALMGRNGSGKTTLLRTINGVIPLSGGSIRLMGRDIKTLRRPQIARLVSVVPQVNFTPFSFSCLDMVLMSGVSRIKAWQSPSAREKKTALSVMTETGIRHLAHRPFNALSGGERQLVMLSRGLFQESPVMLLDEPNTHLDFTNQHHIMSLMKTLVKKRGLTVLITLHDPNLAHYYCDDVILIKHGCVLAQGPTAATMTDDVLLAVLGGNIRTDTTQSGMFVVTPRHVDHQAIAGTAPGKQEINP